MMQLSFFPSRRAGLLAGVAVAAMLAAGTLRAQQTPASEPVQSTAPAQSDAQTPGSAPAADGVQAGADTQGQATSSATLSTNASGKKKGVKTERVQQSKDTRAQARKDKKLNPLVGKDMDLPDKQLYDKALAQIKAGHYDVGRLDLQTLLNTYPDSQYQMRAKLAVADAWYREGGSAAFAQAEQEYGDFITFFPNAPEASEAQMRIGDIYFKQIDAVDRDYSKVVKAEDAYRAMLKTYPDAPPELLTEAKQDLREVQELLAEREAQLGAFYATHQNWAAAIARYQTVVDTYPQYSQMDDVLIGIGDAYAAQARMLRGVPICGTVAKTQQCLPEAAKAKLLESDDSRAAAEYRKVVLEHAAAPHVEDAKERLIDMGEPVPTPTAAQVAASDALEGSRAQYTMSSRLKVLFLHRTDTVKAARLGEPPLDDPAATVAPTIVASSQAEFNAALNPNAAPPAAPVAPVEPASDTSAPEQPAAVPPAAASQPLSFQDVAGPGGTTAAGDTSTMTETAPGSGSGTGTSVGIEVVSPGTVSDRASDVPAAVGAPDPNLGLKAVGAPAAALPAPEGPAAAPDQVNSAAGLKQPAGQPEDPNAKHKPKPVFDKKDESSSKHKPKKGVDKLNPF